MSENKQISIPMIEDSVPCSYFEGRTSTSLITAVELLKREGYSDIDDSIFYGTLLVNGFRRQNQLFYINQCKQCNECIPIRVPVNEFQISKSQSRVQNRNSDIEIRFSYDFSKFVTEEKAFIFREYDKYHNGSKLDFKPMSLKEAYETLQSSNSGYSSILNMDYYCGNELIGVGVLDFAQNNLGNPTALSSNYFYYLPQKAVLKRSLGVFSVLKEIEFCKRIGIPYYYLGLYLPNCKKMNYKANYKPYELLQNGQWVRYSV